MKQVYFIMPMLFSALLITPDINAKQKKIPMVGGNPYTWAPRIFTAENGSRVVFLAGNGTKKYPGKAFVDEIEYTNVVAIAKKNFTSKTAKILRKNKQYLGSYVNEKSNEVFYLYGIRKTPVKVDDSPDAGVLTQIAITEDYKPGE